ncbi:hypothetical protein [Aeromonas salmonicida]|uniref:hypothetical protein n=1 Tax=Aeromonas salmonicida TaxID=645 RepID=UPI00223FE1E5|nr:hypothetical protein [Aeromonas salmonicida]
MSDNWHKAETYKSLITISIEGFKFCALINGGAVVAILAYMGSVASKTACTLPDMDAAMSGFVGGLVACGLALVSSYFTQLDLIQGGARHVTYLRCAFFLVLASIASFAFGAWAALQVF